MSIKCNVCPRWPDNNANNISNLRDKCNNDKDDNGDNDFKYFNTIFTSHVTLYRGNAGLNVNTPFMNLRTNG